MDTSDVKLVVTGKVDKEIQTDRAFEEIGTQTEISFINHKKTPKILVMSGGGMKGMASIGALFALDEHKMLDTIDTYLGTSIGAVLCSLLVLGYSVQEIYDISTTIDFNKVKNIDFMSILDDYGTDDGKNIICVIKKFIINKTNNENITLKELYELTKKKLIITVSCWSNTKPEYFDYENEPDLPLYLALRMSTCYPLLYKPVYYKGQCYIDGGCSDNYPIEQFLDRIDEVIGICFINNDINLGPSCIETYIYGITKCILSRNNKNVILFKNNTITIDTTDIISIELNISKDKKFELFLRGYKSAIEFLEIFT